MKTLTLKIKIIGAVALVFLAAFLAHLHFEPKPPRITGAISKSDLAVIQQIVHREIWTGVLPDYSWKSFRQLPGNIRLRSATHIAQIDPLATNFIHVTVVTGNREHTNFLQPPYYDFFIRKSPTGWTTIVSPVYQDDDNLRMKL